jgi:CRP/FNR family transcriptional regulator, cyclic AMP receptor protein
MDPKRLREVPLFSGLGKRELAQVGQWTTELEVPAGRVLGREGSVAYEFFVIEDGAAKVTIDGEHVTDLGPGDFFGEIGLLERERRTATVTATTPIRVIVMLGSEFRAMEREMPHVAQQVREAIAERLGRAAS